MIASLYQVLLQSYGIVKMFTYKLLKCMNLKKKFIAKTTESNKTHSTSKS